MLKSLNLDQLNLALILACCALSYILPFELVLLSYAILGPAHYLTQINWMHQRQYFAPNLPFLIPAATATVIGVVVPELMGIALFTAVVLAVVSILPIRPLYGWGIAITACLLYILFGTKLTLAELAFAVLLPTVIHIFLFTALFMLSGALRSRSLWGFLACFSLIGCATLFFLVPPHPQPLFESFVANNSPMFSHILTQTGSTFGFTINPALTASFMAFLSFAYTYHYLNWFSKAEVIRWHHATPRAWLFMGLCYIAAVGTYLYDYHTGFAVLLFLSLLHVVLELPLNARTIQSLPSQLANLRRRLA